MDQGENVTYEGLVDNSEAKMRTAGELGELMKEVMGTGNEVLREKFTFVNGVLVGHGESSVAPKLTIVSKKDDDVAIICYGDAVGSQLVVNQPEKSFVETSADGKRSVVFVHESKSHPEKVTARRYTAMPKQ